MSERYVIRKELEMKFLNRTLFRRKIGIMIFLGFTILLSQSLLAKENKEMEGWEKGGAYDQLYNAKEREKFRATVVGIKEVIPMKGMTPGVALEVKESEDDEETILVHVCPANYKDKKEIGIRLGDRLKIRGAWAEIEGEDVFIAAKITKGEDGYFVLKLRLTSDGTPFWSMTAEERAANSD
jgi:hypothetical protein